MSNMKHTDLNSATYYSFTHLANTVKLAAAWMLPVLQAKN